MRLDRGFRWPGGRHLAVVLNVAYEGWSDGKAPGIGPMGNPVGEQNVQRFVGQFTYMKGGGQASLSMAAAGVVCLQEFGQFDDWRFYHRLFARRANIRPRCG